MEFGTRNLPALQLELKLSSTSAEPGSKEVGNGFEAKSPCWLDERRGFGVTSDCCNEMGPSSSTSRRMMAERGRRRCGDSEEGHEGGRARKKLRLSEEQSCYLEVNFKEHNTLNPKQKLAIAKRLNLQPRQVEVWFQNRRARTKLKQRQADYDYLKRCCEHLAGENQRLRKEIQDLRALKSAHQNFHVQPPATALTVCSSCERAAVTPENAVVKMDGFGIF